MNESQLPQLTPTKTNKNKLLTFNETFQSSITEKPQRFMLDKTLVKGIKQNDSSKIVENGEEADLGAANQLYDEQKQISDIFINTRKKYDDTKQVTVKIEQNMEKLKKQKQVLQAQISKIEAGFSQEEREFKNIQKQLEDLNDLCQAGQYTKDIRLQTIQVMKRDILYYKKHCFQANSKIVRNHNRLKTLNNQFEASKKVSSNCRSLIYSIEKTITQKYIERQTKINSYHDIISKKMENNHKREQRQKMIEASMMQALTGKMPEQQQQKRLLLVNICLKRMLKLKMQRQMQKHHQIESIFRKIKQHTTVKRADQFIEKFINRQRNYGELLQKISKSQERINLLKQQKQTLQKEHIDVMFEKQAIEDQENQKKGFLSQHSGSIDALREKLLSNERLKNKCYNWAVRFLQAFDGTDSVTVSRDRPNLCLKESLTRMNQFFNDLSKESQPKSDHKLKQIYIESANLTLPERFKTKNTRIKTIGNRDENFNSAFDDHDVAYDDLSERQFFNQNRKAIKKSNYLRNRIKTRAS